MNLSLRLRLFLLAAVALAPAIFLLGYNELIQRQARAEEVHRFALRTAEQSALEMQRVISGAQAVLISLARAPAVRTFNADLCVPYLRDILAEMTQFTAIAVVDGTGLVRCRSEMPANEINLSDRPYFKEVMAHGEFYVGTYQTSIVSGKALIPLAYPVKADDGSTAGLIVAGLDLVWLNQLVNARDFGPNDALTLADRSGIIIARHPLAERFIGTKIPDKFMYLVTAKAPGTLEVTSQDGTQRIIGYFPVDFAPKGIYVSAGISAADAMQGVNSATQRAVIAILVGAALAFLLAGIFGEKLIRQPLHRIIQTVESWRTGESSARTGMRDGGEIALVGAAVDRFMDDLEHSRAERRQAEKQRSLLNDELEHRVKNTLAVVAAVAGQTFKAEASKPALAMFNGRLSAIGHAYQRLRQGNWQSADLASVIEAILLPYSNDRFTLEGPPLIINARSTLAITMALHELATNAAKYGALQPGDGRVAIAWRVEGDRFYMDWQEHDGPVVTPPTGSGFGSKMITRMLASELSGSVTLDYPSAGLRCHIEAPLQHLVEELPAHIANDSHHGALTD